MGSSILTGAFVVRKLGIVPAILAMLLQMVIYLLLNNFFIDAFYYTQTFTFRDIVGKLVNKQLAFVIDLMVIILAFGTLTSYLLIASNAIINFAANYQFKISKYVLRPILAVLVFPLTCLKNTK